MQSLLHQFQRRPKTTLSFFASTTAAATFALLSTSPFSFSPHRHTKLFSSSVMTSKLPEPPKSQEPSVKEWPARKYTSPHPSFPYSAQDLTPMDTGSDSEFYSSPRFVAHIDENAIAVLKQYYGQVLPRGGDVSNPSTSSPPSRGPNILDLCSSWISHYSRSLEAASVAGEVSIAGIGMNDAELAANSLFRPPPKDSSQDTSTATTTPAPRYLVRDLNKDPTVPPFHEISQASSTPTPQPATDSATIDATTLTVSIDYMTSPLALLSSLLERTRPGGTLHVAVSNRCFPTKAVRRWLKLDEEERLDMVAEILVWSGWSDVEILCLCDGSMPEGQDDEDDSRGVIARALAGMGIGSGARVDPLWVVRGRKG